MLTSVLDQVHSVPHKCLALCLANSSCRIAAHECRTPCSQTLPSHSSSASTSTSPSIFGGGRAISVWNVLQRHRDRLSSATADLPGPLSHRPIRIILRTSHRPSIPVAACSGRVGGTGARVPRDVVIANPCPANDCSDDAAEWIYPSPATCVSAGVTARVAKLGSQTLRQLVRGQAGNRLSSVFSGTCFMHALSALLIINPAPSLLLQSSSTLLYDMPLAYQTRR